MVDQIERLEATDNASNQARAPRAMGNHPPDPGVINVAPPSSARGALDVTRVDPVQKRVRSPSHDVDATGDTPPGGSQGHRWAPFHQIRQALAASPIVEVHEIMETEALLHPGRIVATLPGQGTDILENCPSSSLDPDASAHWRVEEMPDHGLAFRVASDRIHPGAEESLSGDGTLLYPLYSLSQHQMSGNCFVYSGDGDKLYLSPSSQVLGGG